MTRTRDRIAGLEETARALTVTAADILDAAARIEAKADRILAESKGARSSAECAHAGVQALADMLPAIPAPDAPDTEQSEAAAGGGNGEPARRAPKPKAAAKDKM